MKEKKNGEGEGGKYFKKENILFYRGEEKWRRKVRNILGEGKEKHILRRKISLFCVGERIRKRRKILLRGRRRTDKEEEENIQRKVMTDRHTYIQKFLF